MRKMRSICLAAAISIAGCAAPKYGVEKQLTFTTGHPVWAVGPAVNLSGEPRVDPILQADILFQQLQEVNNLTVIPVNRVVAVYAALHIDRVESEEQAAVVCRQLGCDALVIPTITAYDPYNPPKIGAAIQLLESKPATTAANTVDARELSRRATPDETQPLPNRGKFIQVVGMYDAGDGSTRAAVMAYAAGRTDPLGPLGTKEYFVSTDRYCGFVYHTLIGQMIGDVTERDHPQPVALTAPAH